MLLMDGSRARAAGLPDDRRPQPGSASPRRPVKEESPDEQAVGTMVRCLTYFADRSGVKLDRRKIMAALDGELPDLTTLVGLAKKLGVNFDISKIDADELACLTEPVMAELVDGRFVVVLGVSGGKVAVHGLRKLDSAMPYSRFVELWAGMIARCISAPAEAMSEVRIRTLLRHLRKFKPAFVSLIIASIFVYAIQLSVPLTFLLVIDSVVSSNASATLDVVIAILGVTIIFGGILSHSSERLMRQLNQKLALELTSRFAHHVMSLPTSLVKDLKGTEVLGRITELSHAHRFISDAIGVLWVDILFVVACVFLAIHFSPYLGLIVFARLPCYVGGSLLAAVEIRKSMRQNQRNRSESGRLILEAIDGIETIKSRHGEDYIGRRMAQRADEIARVGEEGSDFKGMVENFTSTIDQLATGAMLWIGGYQVINGTLTAGQLMAVYMISRLMTKPMNKLSKAIYDFQSFKVGMDEVNRILSKTPEARTHNVIKLRQMAGGIRFDNVRFAYSKSGPDVLHGISFEVEPGEVVGLVGPSGSGKTTVLKLLQRFYLPTAGRVEIDGTGMEILDPHWVRERIGFVAQDCWVFGQSIADNIRLGAPTITQEHIIEAAQLACAHDFITRMPKGYDTVIRGAGTLSAGERQRIAIARAIVHRPKVLLFDESTSSLDHETEIAVIRNLQKLFAGRTVVIVAHRLSALRDVQKIITLERGIISETGNPSDLISAGGYFSRMVADQLSMLNSLAMDTFDFARQPPTVGSVEARHIAGELDGRTGTA
jgi:subfamily B ATP-binding cassette protein HlyB/CyaB